MSPAEETFTDAKAQAEQLRPGEICCATVVREVCYLRYDRPVLEEFLNCADSARQKKARMRWQDLIKIARSPSGRRKLKSGRHKARDRPQARLSFDTSVVRSFMRCAFAMVGVLEQSMT